MVTSHKTTGRTRDPEYRSAYRQEQLARREPPPGAEPCEVCGIPVDTFGSGAHRRRHILNGDLPEPNGFVRERDPGRRKIPNLPAPTRAQRKAFVDGIAPLPYHLFIEELLKPWDKSSI
jgi:hypothetical protein